MTKRKGKPFQLRLPREVKEWIERQSKTNMSSQNSEIVRAIRAAMSSATDEV